MMIPQAGNFDAIGGFKESLQEVDILCDAAEAAQQSADKYSIFNKAALLLIAGKFESFAESIVEEFIFKLNELGLPSHLIPDTIRLQHTFYALRELETIQPRHKHGEAKTLFCELGKLWNSSEQFLTLKVDMRLSFGKHGESELIKLFERIGITDIFDVIQLTEKLETISTEAPVERQIDFRGTFNSVTSIRNNILHEDASPNLNTVQIREYRRYFENFAIKLDSHLAGILSTLVQH